MSRLTNTLKRMLLKPERGTGRLPPAQTRAAFAPSKGIAGPPATDSGDGTGGVARTEVPDTRTWHPVAYQTSSDGFTVIERENAATITLMDSDGNLYYDSYQDNPADPA